MKMDWKAVVVGAIAYIVLSVVLGLAHSLLSLVGGALGGVVAAWMAKPKRVGDGAVVGLLAGLVGGVLQGAFAASLLSALGAFVADTSVGLLLVVITGVLGLVLGLIGGAVGFYVVKKK